MGGGCVCFECANSAHSSTATLSTAQRKATATLATSTTANNVTRIFSSVPANFRQSALAKLGVSSAEMHLQAN